MASWWKYWLSPPKNWVVNRRLHKYGIILSNYLKSIKPSEEVLTDAPQISAKTNSFRHVEEVEKIINYHFNNPSLLHQAFTHASYNKDCESYERLEYVGDSVLNLLITKEQFLKYPNLAPGSLSPLRAANVDTEKLARVAVKHKFHKYIRLDNPVLRRKIQTFIISVPKHPLHSYGLIDVPKVLADVVESTIGAVFIDSNHSIDITWEVASELLKPIITPEMLQTNPMKKLSEICQRFKLELRIVDQWSQEGTYKIFVGNKLRGKGLCWEKKEIALNRAANDAYNEVIRMMKV